MDPSTFVAFFHDALNAYNKMCEPILQEFDIPQVSFDILMFLKNNPDLCTAQQISEFRNIKKNPAFETPDPEMNYCNCSVPSQLRCKIHSKSASPMGFCITESLSYGRSIY